MREVFASLTEEERAEIERALDEQMSGVEFKRTPAESMFRLCGAWFRAGYALALVASREAREEARG